MAKDHGPSVKNDKQYEGLRKKGMSKSRAAAIANSPGSSRRGGKSRVQAGAARARHGSGGNKAQKAPPAQRAARRAERRMSVGAAAQGRLPTSRRRDTAAARAHTLSP